jgi:threonine aldolase
MIVDLRSDTVTRPTAAMRRVMADAEVGDDIYREDPTVRRLEERVAEILGKDAALFVPSGTMANQIALQIHCGPGDQVIVGEHAHLVLYESGAMGAAGVQHAIAGRGGFFTPAELERAMTSAYWEPRTRLVAIENTHNRAGGRVWSIDDARAVRDAARARSLSTHVDGARVWHAAIACGASEAAIVEGFDTVAACFSKGLGAPVGSAIAGSREAIGEALRIRKRLGGAMRQAGIVAAGALHALEHHRARLADDHDNARSLARGLEAAGARTVPPETNIVLFTPREGLTPSLVCERAATRGVLVSPFGPTQIRAVTHLDVDAAAIAHALQVLASI